MTLIACKEISLCSIKTETGEIPICRGVESSCQLAQAAQFPPTQLETLKEEAGPNSAIDEKGNTVFFRCTFPRKYWQDDYPDAIRRPDQGQIVFDISTSPTNE